MPSFPGRRALASILSSALALAAIWLFSACGQGEGGGPGEGRPPTNVIVEEAVLEPVTDSIDLIGSLAANERVRLQAEINGYIDKILFEEGDEVTQGQDLVVLDQDKLKARLAEAEANYELARSNFERYQKLRDQNTVSAQEFEEFRSRLSSAEATLELRKQELDDSRITAPFDGVMGERMVSPGQYIGPQQDLATLVDINPLKADFNVPERFLRELKTGQKVEIGISAYPDRIFEGEVYFISPFVDEQDRTVLVRALLPNEEQLLKPGMFGSLRLVLNVRENAVIAPETAVIQQGDRNILYVVEDGVAAMRPVRLGVRLQGRIEIREGLQPGEMIIAEGHQKLGPGAPVNPLGPAAAEPRRGRQTAEEILDQRIDDRKNPPTQDSPAVDADSPEVGQPAAGTGPVGAEPQEQQQTATGDAT